MEKRNTQQRLSLPVAFSMIIIAIAGCQAPLDERWQMLDGAIEAAVETNQIPGAVLLTTRDGEVILHRAYGFADPLTQSPMQPNTLFRICSQTKAITSTAALICWEKGQELMKMLINIIWNT